MGNWFTVKVPERVQLHDIDFIARSSSCGCLRERCILVLECLDCLKMAHSNIPTLLYSPWEKIKVKSHSKVRSP